MNARQAFGICLAVLVLGGALALVGDLCRGGTAEAVTDPSAIGRFQIICGTLSQKDVYLLDTANGHTWQMAADPTTGMTRWRPLPPPVERRVSAEEQIRLKAR